MNPEAPAPASDPLTDTGGSTIEVVVVAVESLKIRVWTCEMPKETEGHGAMVIGVEIGVVGEGIETSSKNSSMIGMEVGISIGY